jgi:hypothetical protein
MKQFLSFLVVMLITGVGFAQIKNPVHWSFTSKKINETTYEIILTAKLDQGWHIYSQTTPDGGPTATEISFTKNPVVTIEGSIKEAGKLEQKHEELFGVDVKQYSNKVEFIQTVKLKGKIKTSVNGAVEFMTCNDRECLPPKKEKFSIVLQ